jgi:hypothetical protein
MPVSTYQLARLLAQFRQWRGVVRHPAAVDTVTLTDAPHPPTGPPVRRRTVEIIDDAPHAPVVAEELERRAGSFMNPAYPDPPPPSHIPKLLRWWSGRAV